MSQTSATSTVSGRPPSAPWDICIYFLSPGSHCSPSICWSWLFRCLLGLTAASRSWLYLSFLTFWLDGHTLKDDRCQPFCVLPVWLTGAVDDVFFPQDYCCSFTAVSLLCYDSHLWNKSKSKWFDPRFCPKKASCTKKQPPLLLLLRKCFGPVYPHQSKRSCLCWC